VNTHKHSINIPIPSATVLLLRNREAGIEVFMQQRSQKAVAFGGAYVFPGGKIDAEDSLFDESLLKLSELQERNNLLERHALKVSMIAAIRECYEESGILLAYHQQFGILDFSQGTLSNKFESLRQDLNKKKLSFLDLCDTENLLLAMDQLVQVGRWITPESYKHRFDTRFFACMTPDFQIGKEDAFEAVDSVWWTAEAALEKYNKGEVQLIFPTLCTLEALKKYDKAETFIYSYRENFSQAAF